jgi:hypothetical protein
LAAVVKKAWMRMEFLLGVEGRGWSVRGWKRL